MGKPGGRALAVNVEESTAFVVVATRRAWGGFGRGSTLRSTFGGGSAFRLDPDSTAGGDFLRVVKFLKRKTGFRFDFRVAAGAGGDALGREDEGIIGDVHGAAPARLSLIL